MRSKVTSPMKDTLEDRRRACGVILLPRKPHPSKRGKRGEENQVNGHRLFRWIIDMVVQS